MKSKLFGVELGEYGLWIGAYGEGPGAINADTVLRIYDEAIRAFDIRTERIHGSWQVDQERIDHTRPWLVKRLDEQARYMAAAGEDDIGHQVSLWDNQGGKQIHWYMEVLTNRQYYRSEEIRNEPRLFMGFDLAFARSSEAVAEFAVNTARHLAQDSQIVHGFINPAPRSHVRHPRQYSGDLHSGISWERLVEKHVWMHHTTDMFERVRGLFWGNIYGKRFADRLRAAGYEQEVQYLKDELPPVVPTSPHAELRYRIPTEIHSDNGAMALLLDDSPVWFARKRDKHLDSDTHSVLSGGMLLSVLSKAGLL